MRPGQMVRETRTHTRGTRTRERAEINWNATYNNLLADFLRELVLKSLI